MINAHAHDPDTGVSVEVGPGGALHDLALDARSLRLGPSELARVVLSLVDTATARANQRARLSLRLAEGDVSALGLDVDERLVAVVEDTTPTTWRV